MLAQVLNRDFVLSSVLTSSRELRRIIANRQAGLVIGPRTELDSLSTEELGAVADVLSAAAERESAEAEKILPPRRTRRENPPPKDDYAYMPREPLLGLFQSKLEAYLERALPVEEDQLLDDRRSGPIPIVTNRRVKGIDLQISSEGRRLWKGMEIAHPKILSDPGWIHSAVSIWHGIRRGKAQFVERPGPPQPLANRARIILFGDWGSGLPRAREVAARIGEELADPSANGRQKHVIHLGDVYYGGEEAEYQVNFLGPWPVAKGTHDVASYTLNGNHDMFPGGHAYFGTALKDERFAAQGHSSTFVLANDYWQFLGLDTAYEDRGLHGQQADWITELRRSNPARKTVLLSHHQLFSAYEEGGPILRQKMSAILKEKEIDAWFWGHEHRCVVYRDVERVRFASCIGHGGVPDYLSDKAATIPIEYEYRKVRGHGWQPWITFGFAVLDIDGPKIHMRYIDEDGGKPHWESDLT